MKTNDQFFHSESSANIDECCKQVLDVLTSPLVQPAYSNTVEQAKSGNLFHKYTFESAKCNFLHI